MRIPIHLFFLLWIGVASAAPPALLLANRYQGGIDLTAYWVSEKFDGVRALWDGQRLISRQGHPFPAPAWFTAGFPSEPLDGELWIGRQRFEETVGIVRDHDASDEEWRRVRFLVFDLPDARGDFNHRLMRLRRLVAEARVPWLRAIEQFKVADEAELRRRLRAVVSAGGEGLMLHRGASGYHAGRGSDLLKLKPLWDAEAVVIAHLPGKGKYQGLLGALLVRDAQGHVFRIGTGFRDATRRNPPPIGSTITYRYRGLTRNGLPRFASFLRIRNDR